MELGGGRRRGGGGFPYGNYQTNLHILQPRPPLTAIDKFLWGHNNNQQQGFLVSSNSSIGNVEMNAGAGFLSTTIPGGAPMNNEVHAGGVLAWSSSSCVEESYRWMNNSNNNSQEMMMMMMMMKENSEEFGPTGELKQYSSKATTGKKEKGASSNMPLIKGQWTEDEDRQKS